MTHGLAEPPDPFVPAPAETADEDRNQHWALDVGDLVEASTDKDRNTWYQAQLESGASASTGPRRPVRIATPRLRPTRVVNDPAPAGPCRSEVWLAGPCRSGFLPARSGSRRTVAAWPPVWPSPGPPVATYATVLVITVPSALVSTGRRGAAWPGRPAGPACPWRTGRAWPGPPTPLAASGPPRLRRLPASRW